MQYLKTFVNEVQIEFINDWIGTEIVIVNGKEVSRKYSVFGTQHYFTIKENGEDVNYIITSRFAGEIYFDIIRNGVMVKQGLVLAWGEREVNKSKKMVSNCCTSIN
ncbi:MAG: hypothetical protein J5I59_02540 [Saprospiraceae bacterium]|nr:hypothetical protein [Saprospiraceae bacterium]